MCGGKDDNDAEEQLAYLEIFRDLNLICVETAPRLRSSALWKDLILLQAAGRCSHL